MTTVRPFEADLLHVLQAILGRGPVDRAVGVLLAARPRPKCLGRDALRLIEGTLAKGCVRALARRGGWRRERFLRGDRVVEGRLWERTSPEALGLAFSGNSLEFLIRLVAEGPTGWPSKPDRTAGSPTLGDSLLLYFAHETFRATRAGEALRMLPDYRSHGLCRLAFPGDFAGRPGLADLDFGGWVEPGRAWVLEALQGHLAGAWVASEKEKRKVGGAAWVVAIGREQERVADAYLSALDAAGRRDLARFFLDAARELLRLGAGLGDWTGVLNFQVLRLADRADAHRACLASLASLERLQGWESQARDVGYFDEGYAAAQLWKSDWERSGGDDLRASARALFRSADPLASGN
jgi:hypothetical protein